MKDDRTTRAKLRDAAIGLIAAEGTAALSARKVAARAGMSAGLVAHHFGSMDGLVQASDEHVAALIRATKERAMAQGLSGLDPLSAVRESESGDLICYVAQRLTEESPMVIHLVDTMVNDADEYMRLGESKGLLTQSPDPRGRAAYLVLSSLGMVVLHSHVRRHLGVDLTRHDLAADPGLPRYMRVSLDVTGSVLSETYAQQLHEQLKEE